MSDLRVPGDDHFTLLGDAQAALEKAATIADAKEVRDIASAIAALARSQRGAAAAVDAAEALALRAAAKIGAISRELPKVAPTESGGLRGAAVTAAPPGIAPVKSKRAILNEAGIDERRAREFETLAEINIESHIAHRQKVGERVSLAGALREAASMQALDASIKKIQDVVAQCARDDVRLSQKREDDQRNREQQLLNDPMPFQLDRDALASEIAVMILYIGRRDLMVVKAEIGNLDNKSQSDLNRSLGRIYAALRGGAK